MSAAVGSIAIIGAGRLGCSLAIALDSASHRAGYALRAVASRDPASAEALAARIDGARAASPAEAAAASDLIFLTVPDGEIGPLAASLPWRGGQSAVHCSGALTLDVLAPAADAGALTGCLHPLQSFPSRSLDTSDDASRFRDIACGIEAPPPLDAVLEGIATDLGASVLRLEGVDRARYHAAAVFASNYAVALAAAARRAWELAGLPGDRARAALAPLMLGAAQNIAGDELAAALTGPVARGDAATVERHLAALDGDPALAALYRRLGAELLALDLDHPADVAARLRELFDAD
ncbi:MAG: DUF2520 domain-containing protein [Dehalococcoidia bacterium]